MSAHCFAADAMAATTNALPVVRAIVIRSERRRDATSAAIDGLRRGRGSILLFAGDAQVGNWLSWDDITEWRPVGHARPAQEKPDMSDLLGRTIFYKVGHHGSHNGTLKENGVERMPARDPTRPLTAFVPVSPGVARKLKGWAEMPLDNLLDGLSKRAPASVVLPSGKAWDASAAAATLTPASGIRLVTSKEVLPAMHRGDGQEVEPAVPLWVEVAIRP